jgi:hypothetical protein
MVAKAFIFAETTAPRFRRSGKPFAKERNDGG